MADTPLPSGSKGWFLKSMRRIEVVERHSDGLYTVRGLDDGKELTATRQGIALDDEMSVILEDPAGQAT